MTEPADGSVPDVQQLIAALYSQQRSIDRLLRLLEHRAEAVEPEEPTTVPAKRPTPINWNRVRGDERRAAWRDVAAFAEMLVLRYSIQFDVRPCWWKHPDAVEELTALMHIYESSYADGADAAAAMSWRDNYAKSYSRLAAIFVSCRDGHVDAARQGWMSPGDKAEFQRHVDAEVSALR